MKVNLTDSDGNIHWLAGHDCMDEREWTSVRDFQKDGNIIIQKGEYMRAAVAEFFDRGNLSTTLSFGSTRKFKTTGAAFLYCTDYDRETPREGFVTLFIENPDENGGFVKRYIHKAVVEPPSLTPIGLSVDIGVVLHGGMIEKNPPS